jgi:hypothetical protein
MPTPARLEAVRTPAVDFERISHSPGLLFNSAGGGSEQYVTVYFRRFFKSIVAARRISGQQGFWVISFMCKQLN